MPLTDERSFFDPNLSIRERACFEVGIKLGALYHILCGIPIRSDSAVIESIEKGIEAAISCQPYVKFVKIDIDKTKISGDKSTEFDYDEVTGKIINAKVIIEFESVEVTAFIKWIDTLKYPLMYIETIKVKD
ncbi:MAG: dihydroneopterin aldolase [Candidatus Lokiarchaeota archaeon]|nr:dihydroneopterin aldolase [Candidatus Lokiarchaeota archaeon]